MVERKRQRQGKNRPATANADAVEERAREWPVMSGREPNRRISDDVKQAAEELAGEDSDDTATDEPDIIAQRLEARAFSTGKKAPNRLPHDDETTERMVRRGVNEAEHDEMLAASKTRTKSEG